MKYAVIVIDMLNDFITGVLKFDRAERTVPHVAKLVDTAHHNGIPVIYCCDSHYKKIDKEVALWGEHALAGTEGAQIIEELNVSDNDYVISKRRYSAFFNTELDMLLRELSVDTLIFCGVQTHICVQHSITDAFYNGYKTLLATDGTDCFTQNDYDTALKFISTMYGTELVTTDQAVKLLTK